MVNLTVRITEELKTKLEKEAKMENRSLANYLNTIIVNRPKKDK